MVSGSFAAINLLMRRPWTSSMTNLSGPCMRIPTEHLWIGTDAGLYRWKDNLLRHIALDELWNTPAVYGIMEDSSHVMWLSGPTSVLRIKRQDLGNLAGSNAEPIQGMQLFPVSSELQGAELYGGMQPSGVLDGDGGAWFPTSQGALHINPRQDRPAPPLPPLVIDRVLVDGRPIDFRNGIDLGPGTGMLEIFYAPILLSSQAGLYFRHILNGFDGSWSRPTSERTSVYTNLRAGHYTWELQAFYPSNPQQVSTVSLEVKKEAHFYQTIWFVLFCVVTLALIGWLIDRTRSNQLQSRFRVVMQERSRLAREIHDSVIQGCTGVSVLLEAYSAMPSQQTEAQEHLIYSARQQIKATIDSARDSVWDLRHFDPNSRDFLSWWRPMWRSIWRLRVELEFSIAGDEKPIGPLVAREVLMVVREAVRTRFNTVNRPRSGLHFAICRASSQSACSTMAAVSRQQTKTRETRSTSD